MPSPEKKRVKEGPSVVQLYDPTGTGARPDSLIASSRGLQSERGGRGVFPLSLEATLRLSTSYIPRQTTLLTPLSRTPRHSTDPVTFNPG